MLLVRNLHIKRELTIILQFTTVQEYMYKLTMHGIIILYTHGTCPLIHSQHQQRLVSDKLSKGSLSQMEYNTFTAVLP